MGKSTLLTQLTGTDSEVAAYEFTTLTCIPGVIHYNDAKIQLLDLPGIIEGAAQGKGRGRQVSFLFERSRVYVICSGSSKFSLPCMSEEKCCWSDSAGSQSVLMCCYVNPGR